MEDQSKYHPPPTSKLNLLVYETKQTIAFVYGFMTSFVICILLTLLYDPYGHSPSSSSSPDWYSKDAPRISHLFPNSSQSFAFDPQNTSSVLLCLPQNRTQPTKSNDTFVVMNQTAKGQISDSSSVVIQEIVGLRDQQNITNNTSAYVSADNVSTDVSANSTSADVSADSISADSSSANGTSADVSANSTSAASISADISANGSSADSISAIVNAHSTNADVSAHSIGIELHEYEAMLKCDFYDGQWVRDYSYPLYPHGSCPYAHKSFNCFRNGRPDSGYESYRWQPNHCNIPRLKGENLLELLRGKRLVFVGDSLNRNMWESLMCIMTTSLKDQSRVATSFGRHEFRDYNCSVEFVWSAFLVQEWETTNRNGSKKKTLRLDVMDRSIDKYKDADILIFNSGHWYTDEKTSNGRNFFQERYRIHGKLDVVEAYQRAIITWRKWVEANVNPMNTQVFFRGYSATHFGGGKWNSGGRCDKQTEPIKKKKFLSEYPIKMKILDSVMNGMKIPVHYMNITRLTDYRKDAHPASYRTLHLSKEERLNPLRFQDCSHWCLPGVPDTWNEILYAQILINHYKKNQQKTTT